MHKKEGENSMKRKLKNVILKSITVFAFSIVFGLAFVASENLLTSAAVYIAAVAWLYLFGLANSRR